VSLSQALYKVTQLAVRACSFSEVHTSGIITYHAANSCLYETLTTAYVLLLHMQVKRVAHCRLALATMMQLQKR
jgi:hypothetical protein